MSEATLYVGSVGQGVWRSLDGGQTWLRRSKGMFVECDARALIAHPQRPQTLYAGTSVGCYRSDDGAETWRRLDSEMNDLVVWSLLMAQDDPQTLLAGTRPARLYRSTDSGETWRRVAVEFALECPALIYNRVTTLLADPELPDVMWAGVEIDGVWRSEDRGVTWTQRAAGLSSQDIHGLAVVPANGGPRRLLAATDNDQNISEDEGASWRPQHVSERFPWAYCRGVKQRPGSPQVIFQGNGSGPPGDAGAAWRSGDGSRTFQRLNLPVAPNSTIWDFAMHPSDPMRVYAYSISGQIFVSVDGGDQWEKLPREFGEIRALLWTPS